MGTSAGPSLQGIGRGGDSNLVLEMDAHDAKSYPGEPTENLLTSSAMDFSVLSTYTASTFTQVADGESPTGYACEMYYTGTVNASSRCRFGASTNVPTSGTAFATIWVKRTAGDSASMRPSLYTGYAWYNMDPLDGGGIYITSEYRPFGKAVTLGTNSAGPNPGFSMTRAGGTTDSDKTRWIMPQLTTKSYATPFVREGKGGTGTYNARPATTNLMIHGNVGTGTSFYDSSPSGHTVTAGGNTTHSSGQSKFSGGSIYFDGTDDYLQVPNHTDFAFGSGDFTVDAWIYGTDAGQNEQTVFCKNIVTSNYGWVLNFNDGGGANGYVDLGLLWSTNGSSWASTTRFASGITANSWHHVAVVRSGTTITVYVDGTSIGAYTGVGTFYTDGQAFQIGAYQPASGEFEGYIDEVRVTKGTALWTAAFTPPTRRNLSAPVVDRVNYNGFNCTSTAVTDQATYRDGEVIRLTTPTDALNNIKSAVWDFDGTDDKLFGGVASFDPTGPATINLWLNQDSGNNGITTCLGNASASDRYFNIHPSNTSLMRMGVVSSGGWQYKTFTDNLLDRWAMLTIVNTGSSASPSTYSVYLNGTAHADNPVTYTGSFSDPTDLFVLGNYTLNNSYDTLGQIANVQIYKVALTDQQIVENFNQQRNRFKI